MVIIGIDPGTAITGYGVIEINNNKIRPINYGCVLTDKKSSTAERLKILDKEVSRIIKKYKPEKIAVEDIFFFKNLKTAVKVSQARGVILAVAARLKVPVIEEYTPLQIKQAVSSYGRADKKQVQKMVKIILNLKEIPKPDDAADGLATAICCAHNNKL